MTWLGMRRHAIHAPRPASRAAAAPLHEMTLIERVVALVEDTARKRGSRRVKAVVLEIGSLAQVDAGAIRSCFEAASRGTVADGARLEIVRAAGAGWCPDCAKPVPLGEPSAACPKCGRQHVQMTAGDELRVLEMEVV
jgi:hydrogenase nickel incorporation protein HypA/HybF